MAEQLNVTQNSGLNNQGLNSLLERYVGERIQAQFGLTEVIGQVFTSPDSQQRFTESLDLITQNTESVKIGGRRIRELIGCKVMDFSGDVISDAKDLDIHQALRLGPLGKPLLTYPASKGLPDLDFFVKGLPPEEICRTLGASGFETRLSQSTGGVAVVHASGEGGITTFIDADQSWQTGGKWPLYGIMAEVEQGSHSVNLDVWAPRMYSFPLQIPEMSKDPLDPQRVAAIGRALLWADTSTDPHGKPLHLPDEQLKEYSETVKNFPELFRLIQENPKLERLYRSGIRDMALALRLILLTDWYDLKENYGLAPDRADFFNFIGGAWYSGKRS